jgi:hypothetical protein
VEAVTHSAAHGAELLLHGRGHLDAHAHEGAGGLGASRLGRGRLILRGSARSRGLPFGERLSPFGYDRRWRGGLDLCLTRRKLTPRGRVGIKTRAALIPNGLSILATRRQRKHRRKREECGNSAGRSGHRGSLSLGGLNYL